MENKQNKNRSKKILSYLVTGLIFICMLLLITEISINTSAELKANQSNQSFSVVIDGYIDGQ